MADRLKRLQRYLSSPRPKSRLERLAVERQISDLTNAKRLGLVWDEGEARRNIGFFGLCRHWKGEWAGQPVVLEEWQDLLIIAPLFGWYREDGRRRFRSGYIEIPRKNGKTTLLAGVGLQGMVADGEQGAEVYAAAVKRDQAKILLSDTQNFVRQSPELRKLITIYKHSLYCELLASKLEPLSADHNSMHGLNSHRNVIDELHSHKTRDVWDVLKTSTGARRNPMTIGITTAGFDRSTICWEQHEYTRNILEGNIEDESHFGLICGIDQGDDYQDPDIWWKANPNLGVSISRDYLAEECSKAKASPSYENTVRRLLFDEWTEQAVRWLNMTVWDENAGNPKKISELEGMPCWAGFDLATTRDLSALSLVFPHGNDRYSVLVKFWAPAEYETERQRDDKRQYMNWARDGWIDLTPGKVTDYGVIRQDINNLAKRYDIKEIAFDPRNAAYLAQQMHEEDRLPMVEFGQNSANFTEPTKMFDRLLSARHLQHFGNPVLRWNAGNAVKRVYPNGNEMPDKGRSADKIDGVVATIMGLARAVYGASEGPSPYDTPGGGVVLF